MRMFSNYLREHREKQSQEPTITEAPVAPTPDLSILGGGRSVSFDELHSVATPEATYTYRPIAHYDLVNRVKQSCERNFLKISKENHLIAKDNGEHYFGLFAVESTVGNQAQRAKDQGVFNVIGLRNSHDKKFPAGVMAGDAPFVCSNLCFSNEIVFGRKHTVNFFRDIDDLIDQAVHGTVLMLNKQSHRNDRYMQTALTDTQAHDAIIRAYREGACNVTDIGKVLDYYHDGEDGFTDRNLWSLKNAFTALYRDNVFSSSRRSGALHHALDKLAFVA